MGKLNFSLWLSISEVKSIWKKSNGAVWAALYNNSIKARCSVVGTAWFIEYNSCVDKWGEPVKPELVEEILKDV